jgi:hypothetical protein
VLTQEIGMTFKGQLPTFHVFRKVHATLASKFSAFYHVVSNALEMKRRNLTGYINTLSFYSVDEFLMFKNE